LLNNNQHINYTAADIQKYLQGKMLPNEMHQLEKAALNDPFLADAIEGYEQQQSADAFTAIQTLQQQFDNNNAPIVSINKNKSMQWWRMAAAVFAIVSLAGLVYMVSNKNAATEPVTIAKQENKESTPIVEDTSTTALQPQQGVNQVSKEKQLLADINTDKATTIGDKYIITQSDSSGFVYKPSPSTFDNKQQNDFVVSDQRLDDTKPITENEVATNQTNNGNVNTYNIAANSNATIDINQKRLNANNAINTETLGLEKKGINNEAYVKEDKVRNEGKKNEEVATVGYGAGKRKDITSSKTVVKNIDSSLAGKVSGVQATKANKSTVVQYTAVPSVGWEAYNAYLVKSNQLSAENRAACKGKNIQLSFVVKSSGKIVQIQLLNNLSPACDTEAIRLLKEGPAFIAPNGAKCNGKITVTF
jgi:hypothetical protein